MNLMSENSNNVYIHSDTKLLILILMYLCALPVFGSVRIQQRPLWARVLLLRACGPAEKWDTEVEWSRAEGECSSDICGHLRRP